MLKVRKEGVILSKTELGFENVGVLNPAALREGDLVHLFYRAVAVGNLSSIGYCLLDGPLKVKMRHAKPLLVAEFAYESSGLEDPRLVKIEATYYLTYTAYDGKNALGALAISTDLVHWEKLGVVVPQVTLEKYNQLTDLPPHASAYNEYGGIIHHRDNDLVWDKNLVFFPRRINGQLCFLHRIKPNIQIVVFFQHILELTTNFWEVYLQHLNDHVILKPKYAHEASYVGGGCPPIETPDGWLIIYHGVNETLLGYVYSACAALLDLNNPQVELARLPYPIFFPEYSWELKGEVDNVCFPTGAVLFDDMLYIYYGAADERIACASMSLKELLFELSLHAN